jgi:WD40 repeat protein
LYSEILSFPLRFSFSFASACRLYGLVKSGPQPTPTRQPVGFDRISIEEVRRLNHHLDGIEKSSLVVESYSYQHLHPQFTMPAPEVHHLFHQPIADHSFSADRQTLAIARDNNVELYNRSGSKFTLQDELKGHDKTITGVDIAPQSGRIVTCSQGNESSPICLTMAQASHV